MAIPGWREVRKPLGRSAAVTLFPPAAVFPRRIRREYPESPARYSEPDQVVVSGRGSHQCQHPITTLKFEKIWSVQRVSESVDNREVHTTFESNTEEYSNSNQFYTSLPSHDTGVIV
ncbi:hypothetical protein PHLCEN_2v3169 [Hermanssonia centrifuga]|uniref:Uncharacterized protein n=1 Tax=Hermanssonia centrifuga TaxID=98765 RepID=A0A2R6R0Z1_9APHY|nr:hypothetical protein PHLCEN_2v3169 [Hermanssonia centrifuga]